MQQLLISFTLLFLTSCNNNKDETKQNEITSKNQENYVDNIIHKIAINYGINQWDKVENVKFSFVVHPGKNEMQRKWEWQPKTGSTILITKKDTLKYNQNSLSTSDKKIDQAFVNDSFWLLFPFHLVWDSIAYKVQKKVVSPILGRKSTRLIINYPKEGGYTPGDKYDVYVDSNHYIIEWAYYPNSQQTPILSTTFEDAKDFNGIKINRTYRNPETDFKLIFRQVSFK